ncbi:Putative glycosyltransferase CsbB [Legionella massiliensis]|uniref:Putative glycosyltransferase CsbB n=1 Tax=Legionella massiliensis TaxID=1034943 RepID=A0A078KWW0_9GAMM|nr:glycosyltransferase family 2 protein [Legionella massiliensis]CDZ77502.1 Putative glycosyltransferase CsbB [Legionella massiliensis]CEE13240.1 Putative glycosyltransferase CsbB [Legionella massiliensis]
MSKKLSIIIPVYYNEKNLPITYALLAAEVLPHLPSYELIFVDDGSADNSYQEALKIHSIDSQVKVIKLARNFGQHIAIFAGLEHMSGDCAVVISADLQDPPHLILQMFEKYLAGNKVVIAIREDRKESFFQKAFSSLYYRLMKKYALNDMPLSGFDCFLADKQVVDVLTSIEEKNTSLFAQILWIGFKRAEVTYTRQKREIGVSRWTLSKKLKLAIDSMLAFSYAPIQAISIVGFLDCIFSLIYATYIVIQKVIWGANAGWSSLMVAIMFTSGVQMLTLGVIGEYLWRNFDESRKRPLYVLDEKHGI